MRIMRVQALEGTVDKRTIGWLLSEFGTKILVSGVAVYAAVQAAHAVHSFFSTMGHLPL